MATTTSLSSAMQRTFLKTGVSCRMSLRWQCKLDNSLGVFIAGEVEGRLVTRAFSYFSKGNLAVIGKNYALFERDNARMSGFLAWLVLGIYTHRISSAAAKSARSRNPMVLKGSYRES